MFTSTTSPIHAIFFFFAAQRLSPIVYNLLVSVSLTPRYFGTGKLFAEALLPYLVCLRFLTHHLLWLSDNAVDNGLDTSTHRLEWPSGPDHSAGPCEYMCIRFQGNAAE